MKNLISVSKITLIVSALAIFVTACEEVISIDLNSSSPRLVVNATITDQTGPYYVSLNKSENYFASNDSFPVVTHAEITLSDDKGFSETLTEERPGVYKTISLQGINGNTYHLKIVTEENIYEAWSQLPYAVALDSVKYQKNTQSGPREKENTNKYYVKCIFNDPANEENFYRIETKVNNVDTTASSYQIYNDVFTNGKTITYPLQRPTFDIGDTVEVELYTINKANYDYFKTANNILQNKKGPMASASAPQANPVTNISGGALGYFGTFAVSRKKVIIK